LSELVDALQWLQLVVFAVVAVVTARQWARHRSPPAGWAAISFLVLAVVLVAARVVPEDDGSGALWARKLLIAALALFPYCLFRFAASFRPPSRRVDALAIGVTVVAAAGVFLFDDLPVDGEERSGAFVAYSFVVLVQWAILFSIVTTSLWRAGTNRPTVIRRRMRTLGVGAVVLLAALLVGVVAPGDDAVDPGLVDVAVALLVVVSGPLFLVGLAPPRFLLASWRAPEEAALYESEAALMAATDAHEVADALLPRVAATMGAPRAVLLARDGTETARYVDEARAVRDGDDATTLSVPMRAGELQVTGDRYTPFFGRDETELLARLAALTDVALQRAALIERERDAALELEMTNRSIREFVAVASHDLRTPIAVVKGYASLLATSGDSLAPDERTQHSEAILRQADHLATIVNDLLTVSRIDSGAVDPSPAATNLAAVVSDVVRDLGRDGEVDVDVDERLVVWVDPDHATRIVRNLVENAGVHGSPPVVVTGVECDGAVELRVRDHGPGVSDAFVPRLFERFARAEIARANEKHGTGLGLPIVRGLARAAAGDAWYEPASPGACFVVRLPPVPRTGQTDRQLGGELP
jgi:signal transduction histidine kinase